MRILVVDDSEERVAVIKSHLSKSTCSKYLQVLYCDSADGARKELMASCDLLVLDILIPKKKNGVPQAKNSIALLTDICNPAKNYIRPKLIIGLTADIVELSGYQDQFAREASVVLRGSLNELDWIDNLLGQIESLLGSQKKISRQQKEKILISVHGIRTYGQWQAKLSAEISQHSRSFEAIEVKYGYLDLFSFAVPYLRNKAIKKAANRILSRIKDNPEREIHIVAHSFGTLIVSEALRNGVSSRRIKSVVLCGSPLRHDDNIDHIVQSSELTLNECGIDDFVLILARFFILGLGDAGRIGFERENSDEFINRYFRGGHSLYFKEFDQSSTFYERFWLRFIALEQTPEKFDARRNYFGQGVVEMVVNLVSLFKPIAYTLIPVFVLAKWLI